MWKLLFVVAAFVLSASPLDAAAKQGERSELVRDIERLSREIYPQGERRPAPPKEDRRLIPRRAR
jgi:hypothetical protein